MSETLARRAPYMRLFKYRDSISIYCHLGGGQYELMWTIDPTTGQPSSAVVPQNEFNRWAEAPDIGLFELIDLPPLLPEWEGIAGPGLPGARLHEAEAATKATPSPSMTGG